MRLTKQITPTTNEYWRVVLALAAKDIVDGIKNKTTLTMIIGLTMMMLTVQALPLLLKLDRRPRVAIYDAGRTSLADELRRGGDVRVSELRKEADAQIAAQESTGPILSVMLPEDWESGTGALNIEGYIPHWVGTKVADDLIEAIEQTLTAQTGRPVTIQTQSVYPTLENGGHTIMVAIGMVLATMLITTILVPSLILEEKTTHTLDVLRVSPASVNQVLLGKGLAGAVYGVLAAAVLLAFNFSLVNLWGLMIPAVLAIILFGVGLGLLVGTVVENQGAVQLWIGLLVIVLMFTLMLNLAGIGSMPEWINTLLSWLPTSAVLQLIRLSFGNGWTVAEVLPRLAAVMLAVILVFSVAGWRLKRWE